MWKEKDLFRKLNQILPWLVPLLSVYGDQIIVDSILFNGGIKDGKYMFRFQDIPSNDLNIISLRLTVTNDTISHVIIDTYLKQEEMSLVLSDIPINGKIISSHTINGEEMETETIMYKCDDYLIGLKQNEIGSRITIHNVKEK